MGARHPCWVDGEREQGVLGAQAGLGTDSLEEQGGIWRLSQPKGARGSAGWPSLGSAGPRRGSEGEPGLSQASAGPGWRGPGFPSILLPVGPAEPLGLWCTGPLGFHGGLECPHWASEEARTHLLL